MLTEGFEPYLLDDLMQPHTLGRSFYMRPSQRPQIKDKEYSTSAAFWRDVLDERVRAERNVCLRGFSIFEWVPRNPGLYHTFEAEDARKIAQHFVEEIAHRDFKDYVTLDGAPPDAATAFRARTSADTERTLIYNPYGKISMLRGGVGCVRFKPLELKLGGTAWLMSATSGSAPDEGVPLLMGNADYQRLVDGLHDAGAVRCDVFGRTRFVAKEFSDLFSIQHGIPRLYVEVSEIVQLGEIEEPGQVSVAASFLSSFEGGAPRIYASYVTFDPGRPRARRAAAQWMQEEYVERRYQGSILTDFDQQAPIFAEALFSLDHVMTSPDLAEKIAKLSKLYGRFDWAQLNSFSYIEHQGELIVTNNNITVTNSTNVVIQSSLTNAQLIARSMAAGDDIQRKELQSLLQQLVEALPKAPVDKAEQAEAMATQAKGLVEEAAKAQPNKTILQMLGQGLKSTAEFMKDAIPSTVTIVGQIVSIIGKIHGVPL